MSTQTVKTYRCKQCGTVLRRAEARQEHCYWHHITDKNIDAYFNEEDEMVDLAGSTSGAAVAGRVEGGPSYGVLIGSAAILGAMAILYAVTR